LWFLNDCVKRVGYRILDHKGAPIIAQRKMAASA